MPTKQAKTLTQEQYDRLMAYTLQRSPVPASDRLKLLLSFKAGLRACEIARLKVRDLLTADGRPAAKIEVYGGKFGKHRTIPMHAEICDAVQAFCKAHPTAIHIAISSRKRNGRPASMSPNALTQWYWHLYRSAGFEGASSHSGRRTFGTQLAYSAARHHRTLVDVQALLGHARLDTTQLYIEPSESTFELVNSL